MLRYLNFFRTNKSESAGPFSGKDRGQLLGLAKKLSTHKVVDSLHINENNNKLFILLMKRWVERTQEKSSWPNLQDKGAESYLFARRILFKCRYNFFIIYT